MDEFDIVDRLILNGGLEFAGIDKETGQGLYRPTEKLKDIDPNLSSEMSIYFSETTMKLWEKGFIDMDVTSEDPLVKLAPRSFNVSDIKTLDANERVILEEIIRVLSGKK
jgi:hypothetical protein